MKQQLVKLVMKILVHHLSNGDEMWAPCNVVSQNISKLYAWK